MQGTSSRTKYFSFLLQISFDISFFWLSCLLKVPGRKRHDTAHTPTVVLVFQGEKSLPLERPAHQSIKSSLLEAKIVTLR